MKLLSSILLFLALFAVAHAEQSANQIAIVVIQKYFSPTATDKTAENSESSMAVKLRLNALMISDQVSEEARICYAIKLIDDKIHLARLIKSSLAPIPNEEELLKMRSLMLTRQKELSPKSKDLQQPSTPTPKEESRQ